MNKILRNGIVLPVALGTLLATSLGASAAAPARDNDRHDRKEERQDKRQDKREARQERRQERREDRRDARQDARQDRRDDRRTVTPVIVRPGQPAIVRQGGDERRQERRQDRREDRQERRQDRREIRQDRRAQQRYYDDYHRRLRTLQSRHYSPRWYHSGNYRYFRAGNWHRVNYYGADMLRLAIDQGYREGMRAGQADRYDGWRGGYRNSSVWMDASFGYRGSYVSRAEYNYYFRQGFERGYEDGYYGRYRYGRSINGEVIIIDAVLRAILDLQRWG